MNSRRVAKDSSGIHRRLRNVETLREDGHVIVEPELALAYEVDS